MSFPAVQRLSVGVRAIDAGTEGLCYVMARLFEPMVECRRANGSCDRTQCTRIGALMKFAGHYFAGQERLMEAANYPHDDHHRREHWALLDRLGRMRASGVCADRDRAVVSEVVARWAMDHILESDRRLGSWAVTRRVVDPV